MKEKLMYEWSGCACSEGQPQEVSSVWGRLQEIWGWDGNLGVVGYYDLQQVRERLLAGEREVRIPQVCTTCKGSAEEVYYLKPGD